MATAIVSAPIVSAPADEHLPEGVVFGMRDVSVSYSGVVAVAE